MLSKFMIAIAVSFCFISLAMAAGSSSSSTKSNTGYFDDGVKAIEAGKFKVAISMFQKVVTRKPENADAWNYLGFSNRKLKRFDQALSAYQKALAIEPNHRGANEYLGELYLQINDLAKAKQRLEILDDICTFGCEEFDDLKLAITTYENG
jgi:Flp pilus assembly protein TadD